MQHVELVSATYSSLFQNHRA